MARSSKMLGPERAPRMCEGLSGSDAEVTGNKENCGSTEEQIEGRRGEGQEEGSVDMGEEKAGEVEIKEEGLEGKDENGYLKGDDEGGALKKPNKRGRKKQTTVSSKGGKKEILDEGDVEGSSDFVDEKEDDGEEKLDENGVQLKRKKKVTFVENQEIPNEGDGATMKQEIDLGATGNGQGKNEDILKRRLRAVARKVSYAELEEDDDEGVLTKKRGRKSRRKRKVAIAEGEEDGSNEDGDNGIPAKKRGRRGRPKNQVSKSEDNEGEDVKEGSIEEHGGDLGVDDGKKSGRRGAKKVGKKIDEEVVGNGESSEKQEEESLGMNTKPKRSLRISRVPKEEQELVPDSKKKKDAKVKILPFN